MQRVKSLEQELVDTQRQLKKSLIRSIALIVIVVVISTLYLLLSITEKKLKDEYHQVSFERDMARDSLAISLQYKKFPFEVMFNIGEHYDSFSIEEKNAADSLLEPIVLSFKRAGICK